MSNNGILLHKLCAWTSVCFKGCLLALQNERGGSMERPKRVHNTTLFRGLSKISAVLLRMNGYVDLKISYFCFTQD